jgi:hypothetical protein
MVDNGAWPPTTLDARFKMRSKIKKLFVPAVLAIAVLFAPFAAVAQSSLRQVPMVFCSLSSMTAATGLASGICASFTGSGSGTNLTTTSVTGSIQIGQTVAGSGVPSGTKIVSQTSGTPNGAGVMAGMTA